MKKDKIVFVLICQAMSIKIATCLEMPICTVRAVIKKFKIPRAVIYLPGSGHKCILSPHTVRRLAREAKLFPRILVVKEDGSILGFPSVQSTISFQLQSSKLFQRRKKSLCFHLHRDMSSLTGTGFR